MNEEFINENVLEILSTLEKHFFKAFIVGGAIRNYLFNQIYNKNYPINDYDLITDATYDQLKDIFDEVIEAGYLVSKITFRNEVYEIATFRYESDYKDYRHPSICMPTKDLMLDLMRRDFTVNAIIMDYKYNICDYHYGISDLKNNLLKTINDPFISIREDVLRILRALNLVSSYGFDLEEKLYKALVKNVVHLDKLPIEVISIELRKIFTGQYLMKVLELNIINKFLNIKDIQQLKFVNCDLISRLLVLLNYNKEFLRVIFYFGLNKNENNLLRQCLKAMSINNIEDVIEQRKALYMFSKEKEPLNIIKMVIDIKGVNDLIDYQKALDSFKINSNSCFSLKDLKVNGDDCLSLGIKKIKVALDYLLMEVIEEQLENEYHILIEKLQLLKIVLDKDL